MVLHKFMQFCNCVIITTSCGLTNRLSSSTGFWQLCAWIWKWLIIVSCTSHSINKPFVSGWSSYLKKLQQLIVSLQCQFVFWLNLLQTSFPSNNWFDIWVWYWTHLSIIHSPNSPIILQYKSSLLVECCVQSMFPPSLIHYVRNYFWHFSFKYISLIK